MIRLCPAFDRHCCLTLRCYENNDRQTAISECSINNYSLLGHYKYTEFISDFNLD